MARVFVYGHLQYNTVLQTLQLTHAKALGFVSGYSLRTIGRGPERHRAAAVEDYGDMMGYVLADVSAQQIDFLDFLEPSYARKSVTVLTNDGAVDAYMYVWKGSGDFLGAWEKETFCKRHLSAYCADLRLKMRQYLFENPEYKDVIDVSQLQDC